jgi:hypothetical protein
VLTAALTKALDPDTKADGLRAMLDFTLEALPETPNGVSTKRLNVACVAGILLFGFGVLPGVEPRIPKITACLIEYDNLSVNDLTTVVRAGWDSVHAPRDAAFLAAAQRLAEWADAQVAP